MVTGMSIQIGANSGDALTFTISSAKATSLNAAFVAMNTATTLSVGFQTTASAVISALDTAIDTVSTYRSNIGAMQNRLSSATNYIGVASENTAAANSRIADADIATSMSELVRAQILQQAGISVLAQANQAPSLVLQLLK